MTKFDTVVLFEVENLLGEPARWKQAAAELSFGDIIAQLRRDPSGLVGDFAASSRVKSSRMTQRRNATRRTSSS